MVAVGVVEPVGFKGKQVVGLALRVNLEPFKSMWLLVIGKLCGWGNVAQEIISQNVAPIHPKSKINKIQNLSICESTMMLVKCCIMLD